MWNIYLYLSIKFDWGLINAASKKGGLFLINSFFSFFFVVFFFFNWNVPVLSRMLYLLLFMFFWLEVMALLGLVEIGDLWSFTSHYFALIISIMVEVFMVLFIEWRLNEILNCWYGLYWNRADILRRLWISCVRRLLTFDVSFSVSFSFFFQLIIGKSVKMQWIFTIAYVKHQTGNVYSKIWLTFTIM